jgi:hypothetical protein
LMRTAGQVERLKLWIMIVRSKTVLSSIGILSCIGETLVD